ncbi:MAG TPA: cell division topological specificity factor MinE [Ktedonobacteraceae bacterium]|jgi:cell division topological specificity factor|nr:cell division topological specificity factor MinE [Ktedonobacteraceae bacterium]
MGVFEFISGRKKQAPGQLAKERLKVVLVQDRIKLSPELLELIKADLLTAISRRLEVDEQNVQISMARENRWDKLQADMPIKRQKVSFEWDPPAHTTAANVLRGKVQVEVEVEREEQEHS